MGSEPEARRPATTTRQLDAAGALKVQRLLEDAARSDGYVGLSDQLVVDLADLARGGPGDSIVTQISDGDGLAGLAMASRHDGDWTMQVVRATGHRDESALHELVTAVLGGVAAHGGGRVDWWVYAPDESAAAVATSAGLRADRRLLQMRRRLPTEQRPEVSTRAFRPGHDEQAWLEVNNRAFAGHHEQHGWTLHTLRQRMRQPWFAADDLRLHERDGRLAAFCWTKRHPPPTTVQLLATPAERAGQGLPNPSAGELETAEGSASDEADAARAQSEAAGEPAMRTGSASDEADAARAQSEAEAEPAMRTGSASDEAEAARAQSEAAGEPANEHVEPAMSYGEIYVIGVDPDFQGLGLGPQLTLAGLDHLWRTGVTEALLYVAGENTAALHMYERLGFGVHRVDLAYVGEVTAAAG